MTFDPFHFELPDARIALYPAEPQDTARLLIVHGDGRLEDAEMLDLPSHLKASDVLVFNGTKVIAAALKGLRRARDEIGRDVVCDINLIERLSGNCWRALVRPGRRLRMGDVIEISSELEASIIGKGADGEIDLQFALGGLALDAAIDAAGMMPLPPYIARKRGADARDRETYQTRFASGPAQSVAAPTAGLHFTPRLISALEAAGIDSQRVRLTVGAGTFRPLTEDQIAQRRLHEEWRVVSPQTADALNTARTAQRRIIPVGTTALRTLESATDLHGHVHAVEGPTDIFLQPGDRFRITGGLITNFHLPASSLFRLVCALMGTDIMQAAYAHAIRQAYRFYSYGDACLLLP